MHASLPLAGKMATERVVFWDFDGTLARREDLWAGALRDAWRCVDDTIMLSAEQLRPHLRKRFPWHDPSIVHAPVSAAQWWAALHPVFVDAFTASGADPALAAEAASQVATELYRVDAWKATDGAEDALALTRNAGFRNIILSNHAPELPGLVEALELSTWVEETLTSAAIGAEKPNPAIFEFALRRAGVTNRESAWMVGDNPIADVEGARGVGIPAILADGSHPDAQGVTVLQTAQMIVGGRLSDGGFSLG